MCRKKSSTFESGKYRFGKGCYYYSRFRVTLSHALDTCDKGRFSKGNNSSETEILQKTRSN